ncbi:MAG: iron transporter [Bacteroidetes bacterium]|nr:iron transporter [Bacteroidota bacterium]
MAVAATGIGAGDVVAAAVSGAQYGAAVLWAALVGALVKFALNEGIARWQLATGTTLLEGWGRHLHRFVLIGFAVYLVLWTVVVAGALIAACGLAAHAIAPQLSVAAWGILHSLAALGLVYVGQYTLFERLMKGFIALMFVTVVTCAVLVRPDWGAFAQGLFVPSVPLGSGPFLLGVIGGVGGSVTLLSYSYWIRERGWTAPEDHVKARFDLGAAYLLTAVFGVAIIITAAGVDVGAVTGNEMALAIAQQIGRVVGPTGKWIFLVGFWGAVSTSMLGVWQGVPYIFADFMRVLRATDAADIDPAIDPDATIDTTAPYYRGYLLFTALVPMTLLAVDRPVWVIIAYSVAGAFFMPFLAGTLLYLNTRRRWVAALQNGWLMNGLLVAALLLFGYLCVNEIATRL